MGGYIPETENTDLIAVNSRRDQAEMQQKAAEWEEREIHAPRRARKIAEEAEAAEKKIADDARKADRAERARAGFARSIEGAKNLVSSLRCVASNWKPEAIQDQPELLALLCHDLEQLISFIRDKQDSLK